MLVNRNVFDEELRELKLNLLHMGGMVERSLNDAVESLKQLNRELAQQVVEGDTQINQMEQQIEERVIQLILRQQPVAKDLRKIMAAQRIAGDLERMGDLAVGIAKGVRRIEGDRLIKPLVDIPKMAELAKKMVSISLHAYVDENAAEAKGLAAMDDQVDALFNRIIKDLLDYFVGDNASVNQALQLSFIGRHIERIADHATNVGESVVYLVEGKRMDLN